METAAMDNRDLLEWLFARGEIRLERSHFVTLPPAPLPRNLPWERVEGMLLGLAIGDNLGNLLEGTLPDERGRRHGEVRDYLPNRHAAGRTVGTPSDDTQLAFWTLEQLLQGGGLVPDHLANRFCREQIFGLGGTMREFLRRRKAGTPCYTAGVRENAAGNGALMRIAPVLLPHLRSGTPALWADAAIAGMLTHNDRASNAACIALVHLLWETLRRTSAPDPEWWLATFCRPLQALEGDGTCYRPRTPHVRYEGPLWRFTREQVERALEQGLTSREACDRWYSGAYLLETVPSVLYLLIRHGHDPEEAIIRAVNDTRDNNTIAAVGGAVVGALHGLEALPARWRTRLLGRTGTRDDGEVFDLIGEAARHFAPGPPADAI